MRRALVPLDSVDGEVLVRLVLEQRDSNALSSYTSAVPARSERR